MDLALFEHVAAGPLRHRLHVAADAEEVTGAGQHHDIDGVIVGEVVPDRAQFADQFLVDGIARLRPVQGHGRHLVGDLDRQAFILGVVGHVYLHCYCCLDFVISLGARAIEASPAARPPMRRGATSLPGPAPASAARIPGATAAAGSPAPRFVRSAPPGT
ncbi:hypothetical protein chiPu_0033541, partial [Chiloscyllium punctatum]|nr:hypothetical protein [Chiloscyllium punctatum]